MKKYLLPLFGMALYFTACDDELAPISGNTAETVAAFSDLSECNKNIVGKFVYVSDSVKMYACTDEGWAAITGSVVNGKNGSNGADGKNGVDGKNGTNGKNGTDGKNGKDGTNGKDGVDGKDGKSCIMTAFKDGTGFDVICDGKSIGTVKNGTDGAKGKDGTNGKDGTSCSVAKAEKSNDVIVTCGKESVTIHNGVDGQPGTPGTNGANGKDGTSCSVAKAENSDDVVVTCGEKSVTIHNGVDGQPGAPGASGASCKIASDKDGVVQLQCGEGENATTTKLYKAMCGTQPYDPETSLCKEGQVYFKCGNDTYDPKKEFCYENQKYDFCENDEYNPSEKFCVDNKLYDFCNGSDYDPVEYECKNGVPVQRPDVCGGITFDPDLAFCAEFTTSGTKVKQVYKKVTITMLDDHDWVNVVYSKTWMKENLKYDTEGSYCYKNTATNCDKYGKLYTWDAAKNACPDGWHLPSKEEWEDLFKSIGGIGSAGTTLKDSLVWNGMDLYGFSALPGGEFISNVSDYRYIGDNGAFWTSDADGKSNAYGVFFATDVNKAVIEVHSKNDLFSVRCIKDENLVTE
jgi:uncharacterized protein (TIGR02145 family)